MARMVVDQKKRLNALDGRAWTRYSISIWDVVKTHEENKLKHPAMFPVELCKRLIDIYTKKGDVVLDPFMGSGSCLVAAKDRGRASIGLDINPDFVKLTKSRLAQEKLVESESPEPRVICDDAINVRKHVEDESVDLCITSPPYWSVHLRKRSSDYKESRPYSDLPRDLGNVLNYEEFMGELSKVFGEIYKTLKHGKRCIVIVMDLRVKSKFIPFHMDIIKMMEPLRYILEDIVIWDRKAEYNNLRPLGYPYAFIVNKIHEYILIFRRNQAGEAELAEEDGS